jgi:exosome complex exonuclease DIS3/RRP44
MRGYITKYLYEYPELLDLLAADISISTNMKSELIYKPHLTMPEISIGLKSNKFLRGTIRCKKDSCNDCYVVVHTGENEARKSVIISGQQLCNRAVDGDVVAVKLISKQEYNEQSSSTINIEMNKKNSSSLGVAIPDMNAEASLESIEGLEINNNSNGLLYGSVVGIIQRKWKQYAGSLDNENNVDKYMDGDDSALVQFISMDKRIPPINIITRRRQELSDSRLIVSIDNWPANSLYPHGHLVRVLGKNGDKSVETAALLHEFDVPHSAFTAEVMSCLPSASWSITPDIVAQRTDLRHIPVVSIDPPGCKDIDDALHCIRLPNGNLEAGVHIADVTHFLHPETPIDKEAAHRSTSTYLVERRLDMLPGLLTTQLCSLRSTEDHLAFSIVWEITNDGDIIDVKFFKSAIRSVASLTYDEAQVMLDNPTADKVSTSVNLLNKLAKIFRQKRIDAGALTLASTEVRFKMDEDTHNPTDVTAYALKESNALVEEWMLLANITVSKKILRHYPTLGLLRRHQPPSRTQFAPLLSAAASVGVTLDITSSKTLADSLDDAVRPNDPYFNKFLRILSTRYQFLSIYLSI